MGYAPRCKGNDQSMLSRQQKIQPDFKEKWCVSKGVNKYQRGSKRINVYQRISKGIVKFQRKMGRV